VISTISALARPIRVVYQPVAAGDVRHTAADTSVAHEAFGYEPETALAGGLKQMIDAAMPAPAVAAS
jgi:UDP-glucuronate 4-epimerase